MSHSYGYIPDLPDMRDYRFSMVDGLVLPKEVDLRDLCPPIEDQGSLGSCTSFAAGAAIRVAKKKQGLSDFVTSHLFLYYNSRSRWAKTIDSGATLRDTIKSASKQGDCPEIEWPYIIDDFDLRPSPQCYKNALKDRAINYQRISQSLVQMKSCLTQGFPFVIGFTVYASFESDKVANTGMVPLPKNNEAVLGGHAVLVVGYRDSDLQFICRNSWSENWGDGGYFYMPYAYLHDRGLSGDFWTIKTVGV